MLAAFTPSLINIVVQLGEWVGRGIFIQTRFKPQQRMEEGC